MARGLFYRNPNGASPLHLLLFVKLSVYNVLGEKVATIVNSMQRAGRYEVNFNASNLSSGVYVYRIETTNFTASKKLMLMK